MKNLFSLLLLLPVIAGSAQIGYYHSGGLGFYVGTNGLAKAPALTYSPRLNIALVDEISFSIGSHIGLGLLFPREGPISYVLDAPIVAELNLGHGATYNTLSSFGIFLGAGLSYTSIGDINIEESNAAGYYFSAGVRIFDSEGLQSIGLRTSFLLNTKQNGANIIALCGEINFGDY